MNLSTILTLFGVAGWVVFVPPLYSECPLQLRTYVDLDQHGFVLEVEPPLEPQSPVHIATGRLLDADRGEIVRFEIRREADSGHFQFVTRGYRFPAYFFSRDLHSDEEASEGHYLFLANPRSADWQPGSLPADWRENPFGDVLWELAACKE